MNVQHERRGITAMAMTCPSLPHPPLQTGKLIGARTGETAGQIELIGSQHIDGEMAS